MVFEPQAVGWLLDLLGATAFNGLAHAEGRGALVGRLGQLVAAPAINLSDSPTSARTLPRAFDAEATRKTAAAAAPGRDRLRRSRTTCAAPRSPAR